MAVAAHILGRNEPPPPELKDAWLYRRWGVNILDLPAGQPQRMQVAINAYEALKGWQDAGRKNNTVQWSRDNPAAWELASWMMSKWLKRGKK